MRIAVSGQSTRKRNRTATRRNNEFTCLTAAEMPGLVPSELKPATDADEDKKALELAGEETVFEDAPNTDGNFFSCCFVAYVMNTNTCVSPRHVAKNAAEKCTVAKLEIHTPVLEICRGSKSGANHWG